MPIFESDGQQYEVEDRYSSDFAKAYPNAVTRIENDDHILEVSASDYPAYLDTQRAPRRVVPEKTTIPGSHAKPYQMTPEEMGFENVLDKDNFQERYGVSPSVMERQTDPIKESVQRLRAKVGSRSNIPQYPIGNRYTFGFGSDYANKEADNIASSQLSAATENELRGAEKAQSKDGFWKSFGKGLKDEGMWTQGLTELDNNLTLAYIAKKAEKEGFDKLPEKEQDLLTASALRIASEAAYSDEKTALQIAGMSTAESIPYMLQFMLTSSPASLATSPVRSAIKKAAEKAIKSGISSKLIPVVKGAARTAAVGAKATAMTAMQPTMYADMVSRVTGKATLENGQYSGMEESESAPMAAYKAFANATIENISEHSGSMLSGATKAAGNVLKKVPALGGFISNVQKNNVLSGVNKMMKAVGFNGAPEEFFEEQVSTGLNSLLVGDSQFSDFVDWKQQLATLISVGATAGAITATGSVMSQPYKKQIKNNYLEATDLVKGYFSHGEFDQFRASLSRMNIDSRPDFISSVAEAKGFGVNEVKHLTVFATRQAQYDGYVGSVIDKIKDGKIKAQNELDRISNKSMGEIIEVKMDNKPTNIVGGFVVFNENGTINNKRSSQIIYYLDEDGKRKMASPDKFGELVSRKPLADAYAEVLNPIEDDILIKEENDLADLKSQEKAQKKADLLTENDNLVETPEGIGAISHVEPDENSAIVVFSNGRSKRFALPELKPVPVAQDVTPDQQSGIAPSEEILDIQPETPMQSASVFPVDKEDNIDYSQIQEPEMYAQALQQEFEGDAVSVIDEQIQSAQARLDKASKNTDAIARRRAMKEEQAEVERLNKVKEILTPVQQNVSETALDASGNANPLQAGQNILSEEELSMLTEPERRLYVVENSNDPLELADLYEQVKDETEYSEMLPWQAALLGRRVNKDSFVEHSDKNNITGAIAKSWFADKESGKKAGLDVIAAELSEYGIPVTENDIVEFILEHPGNSVKKRSKVSMTAERRFKQLIKDLTGENVGGLESNSGRLVLAGLRAGVRAEQEKQALPYDMFTIPDPIINFFEETGLNPDDFNSFEELNDAVQAELEKGTFVFPLGESDLKVISNIVQHGIEQQGNYQDFVTRVEKAGTKRAAEQPVLETTEGQQFQPIREERGGSEAEEGRGRKQVDNDLTPEEIAEIESQLETPKRKNLDKEEVSAENELFYRISHNHFQNDIAENDVISLSESFNTPIKLVEKVTEITNDDKRKEKRMRSAKGWYDPKTGEVVIVLPNAESVGDVQATILHEVVGHKGLRGLLGDKFEDMMDKVFEHLPKATRKTIMELAVNKYRFDHRTATEEYLAEFVERDVMEPSIWKKIKSAIKSFFRDLGVNIEMNDADIAYLLWKSKNRLLKEDGPIEAINNVAAGEEAKERFREAAYTDADVLSDELDKSAREAWERLSKEKRTAHEIVNETAELRKGMLKYFPTNERNKKSIYSLIQAGFDNAIYLKNLQGMINSLSHPVESFENPYLFLTTIPSRNEYKMNQFVKKHFYKIGQAIKEMGVPQSTVQVYAYLKHGIERNEYMRKQDVKNKRSNLREYADSRIEILSDQINKLSNLLDKADNKTTRKLLAEINGIREEIERINQEMEVNADAYAESVKDKDYSGVFQVADLFISKTDRELTVPLIEKAIAQFEKDHNTANFWKAVNESTRFSIQNEFETGRLSKDTRDRVLSMYNYYIPLKGWEEKNANEEWDYVANHSAPVSPIKKAGGRTSLAQNPFENIGLAAQTSVMGGHKNLLKQHMLRMVRNHPNPMYRVSEVWAVKEGDDWVQKAPEYSEAPEVYADNVVKFEEEMNVLKEQGLAKKMTGKLDLGKPITRYEAKEHEIIVYENGKPYVIYINGNPDIARAINLTSTKPYDLDLDDKTGKDFMKKGANSAYSLMRFTSQNLTSRNPAFIAANLVMDSQWAIAAAAAKEGSDYVKKLVGNYMSPSIHRSIMRGIKGKLDESNPIDKLFGEFQRAGGETGYSDLFKVDDFEKMIKNELKEGADWRKAYTWYTGSIDKLNRWAELTSRFSAYMTSRSIGRDIARSASDAKEITLNFNRKGTGAFGVNWLRFAYLFAGAGLQGIYSIYNLLTNKRTRKRITIIFTGIALLGFIVPLINEIFLGDGDDDDLYSNKPDYERKSNILVRIPGSDSFFKIPIHQSLRPFYNIGETMYQMVKGNRNAGEGTMDIIAGFGMLLPFDPFGGSSLVPSAFQPVFQVKENKDFFGRKIYKDDSFTQYDPEFKRAFSNTSPAFVELTRALNDITGGDEVTKGMVNVNPAILEHLVEGYLGGAFKFVNDIGKQVNGAIEVSKGNAYPYDSRSYPIVGRFYTNTAATSDINAEYYKVINDSEELNHRVRKYQELGKKGDSEAFEKSLELMNSPEYKKAIFVKAFKKRIDNLKKTAKEGNMENNPVLKDQERELKIIMLNEIEKIQ